MLVHANGQKFDHKATGAEIREIKNWFTEPRSIKDLTIRQIAKCLANGRTIQPGVTPFSERSRADGKTGTVNDDFERQTLFMSDIDNKREDIPLETPEHVAEVLAGYNLKVAFMYETFSSTPEHIRFRFALVSDTEFTDKAERDRLQEALMAAFPQADQGCGDAARLFLGTNKGLIKGYTDFDAVCAKADLLAFADAFNPVTDPDKAQKKNEWTKFGETIPAGQRHGTLVSFAATVLKKLGVCEQAYDAYMERVAQCEEPKPDEEIEKIWRDACAYYESTIAVDPKYLQPEEYAVRDFADSDMLSDADANQPKKHKHGTVAWEDPIPFGGHTLMSFPLDALPAEIRDYVAALSESVQTPVDLAGAAALGVIATCVQGKYTIQGKPDWVEPLNLYLTAIASSSERKSAVQKALVRPINDYEEQYNLTHAAAVEASRMRGRILLRRQKAVEEQFSKGKIEPKEVDQIASEVAEHEDLQPMRLFVDDITPEKLASVLAQNNGRMAVLSSEAGIFDTLAGAYAKLVNIDVMLKGYSGDPIRVDRIRRDSESIMRPTLTVLLMAQPGVVSKVLSNTTFRGRGLTARFLFAMPESSVGSREYRTPGVPKNVYAAYAHRLVDMLEDDYDDEPEMITLSPEADALLEQFSRDLEPKLVKEYAEIADWCGKLAGNTLRIAGLLCRASVTRAHVFADANDPLVVDAQTMQNAICLGKYFLNHAQVVFNVLPENEMFHDAERVLKMICEKKLTAFNRRTAMRYCQTFKRVEDIQPVLEFLEDYGYIASVEAPQTGGKGRPPMTKYVVNPAAKQYFCHYDMNTVMPESDKNTA